MEEQEKRRGLTNNNASIGKDGVAVVGEEEEEEVQTVSASPSKTTTMTAANHHPRHLYRLVSVICHSGEDADVGHYTCDVLDLGSKPEKWQHYDDSRRTEVDRSEVFSDDARRKSGYVFFYVAEKEIQAGANKKAI